MLLLFLIVGKAISALLITFSSFEKGDEVGFNLIVNIESLVCPGLTLTAWCKLNDTIANYWSRNHPGQPPDYRSDKRKKAERVRLTPFCFPFQTTYWNFFLTIWLMVFASHSI
jgi:hypothetical protein